MDESQEQVSKSGRQMFVAYLYREGIVQEGMTDDEFKKAVESYRYLDLIGGRVITFQGLGVTRVPSSKETEVEREEQAETFPEAEIEYLSFQVPDSPQGNKPQADRPAA